MTQPENYTAAQASDPQTPAQTLADIAALRPDLRPAIASNPSTYPELLEWLKSLGEPAVDAALAARAQATQVLPTTPAPAAPAAAAPAQPWASAPAPGQAPGQYAPGAPGGYGAPAPGVTPGYAGTPAKSSNKTALWIVLVIVALVLVAGGVIVALVMKAAKDVADDVTDTIGQIDRTTQPADDPMSFGDDPQLDALYTACAGGDWKACDDLYAAAPIDSEYFAFGDTCGGQWEAGTTTFCVEAMNDDEPEPVELSAAEVLYLDALQAACAAGDWAACDDLYWDAPIDSDYEAFGDTCGERTEGTMLCVAELGDGNDPGEPMTRGSSAGLDALWDACEGGAVEACDLLYWNSPIDSEYEAFAQSRR